MNLTLEVLAKREDGFHEIRSVVQAISLGDLLQFQKSRDISFNSDEPGWVAAKSLVSGAAARLREATGCKEGAVVKIIKRIPLVAGLGGDSSDGAAVLRGLNELWELGLSRKELVRLAMKLGSDVAFFLYGGTALVEGRGEIVTPLLPMSPLWAVLVMPQLTGIEGKTGRLYASLRAADFTDGQITERLVNTLRRGGQVDTSTLFNVFDGVAMRHYAGIEEYRRHFLASGAGSVHLAGSGPALFSLVSEEARAMEICRRLEQQGMRCFLAETVSRE